MFTDAEMCWAQKLTASVDNVSVFSIVCHTLNVHENILLCVQQLHSWNAYIMNLYKLKIYFRYLQKKQIFE